MAKKIKTNIVKKAAVKAKKASPKKTDGKKKLAPKKKGPRLEEAPPSKVRKKGGTPDSIVVRMYAHGFGDCFLLTFLEAGEPIFCMLVDCGMLTGNSDLLKRVIRHVKADCGGRLDVVIQTHEHKDHISGFNLKDDTGKLLWDGITVDEVWLAWTENTRPEGDRLARQLKDKFQKKKNALTRSVGLYNKLIEKQEHKSTMQKEFKGEDYFAAQERYSMALSQILQFFDIGPEQINDSAIKMGVDFGLTMDDAMNYFIERNKAEKGPDVFFWDPGDMAEEKQTGLKGVRFYFLGPPKNYDRLRQMDDKEHVEMYISDMGLSDNFYLALSETVSSQGAASPFNQKYFWTEKQLSEQEVKDKDHVWNLYKEETLNWRKIEYDWLHNSGALALQLDSYTNNTSLVFAIEFEESGKVLLFPADAQIGNWISWTEPKSQKDPTPKLQWKVNRKGKQELVTASQLLERTVFYKVGHHASHNATARNHGLELMDSKDLVAMIPVDEVVARKQGKRGWEMPAKELYDRLLQKTKGRVIRLDKGSILKNKDETLPEGARPSKSQRNEFNQCYSESNEIIQTDDGRKRPLFFEYLVKG